MNKKLFPALALTCSVLFGACSNEDVTQVIDEGNRVSFTAQLPEQIRSRTYSDGTTATALTCYVYQKIGNDFSYVTSAEATISSLKASVSFNLMKGETYAAVFWAQAPNAPYSFDVATATMSMNYLAEGATEAVANDELRDAFYYRTDDFRVDGSSNSNVTLTRPFAQVNIGASDLATAAANGYIYNSAKVTANTYATLNLLTGEPDSLTEVTFAEATFPSLLTGDAKQSFPIVEEGVDYDYLSMNYLLVNDRQELRDIVITLTPTAESKFQNSKTFTYSNVPVKRNYRTNIYGTLLTNGVNYNVALDQDYTTPDYNNTRLATTAQEFVDALATAGDGDCIIVNGTIDLSKANALTINADITIEVPTGSTITTARQATGGNIVVAAGKTLTIKGQGTFSGNNRIIDVDGKLVVNDANFATSTDNYSSAITVNEGGELIFNSGLINAAYFALYIEGKATINGGDIVSTSAKAGGGAGYCVVLENANADLVVNGGYLQGAHGVVGIDAGSFTLNDGMLVAKRSDAAPNDNYYAVYIVAGEANVAINGGYLYSDRTNGAIYLDDSVTSRANGNVAIVGGTFSDRGNLDSDGNPKITPANGYAWQLLDPAETVTTHGYDLTFNYIVSLQ